MKLYLPFTNNVIVTVVGTVGHVFLSSMAGYVLIQKGFPEKVDVIRDPVNDDDSERGDHDPAVYRESGFRSPKHAVLIDTFGFRIRLQRRAHAKFLLSVPYEIGIGPDRWSRGSSDFLYDVLAACESRAGNRYAV